MDNSEILEATLNATIQRFAQKTQNYEVEIANLTAQVIMLQSQVEKQAEETPAKATPVKAVSDK